MRIIVYCVASVPCVSSAVTDGYFPVVVQTIEFDEGAGAVLRIQPLRAPRDENIYECVARNSGGEVSVTAKLAIIRGEAQNHTHTHTNTLPRSPPLIPLEWCLLLTCALTWLQMSYPVAGGRQSHM